MRSDRNLNKENEYLKELGTISIFLIIPTKKYVDIYKNIACTIDDYGAI